MENVSIQYWEQKISEWETSGLNVRDWCQKKQIDLKQFYTWKNKLTEMKAASEEPVFVEVTSDYQPKQQHSNFIPS